jgi:hypothetical protein
VNKIPSPPKTLNDIRILTIMLAPKLRLRAPWLHVHVTSRYAGPKGNADAQRLSTNMAISME